MNTSTVGRFAVAGCAVCAMAAMGGCPQSEFLAALLFDTDPPPPAVVETVTETPNTPPDVDAGGDLTVNAGDPVFLDASATRDADGDQMLFWWAQTTGDAVDLVNGFSSVASFSAPEATASTTLTFRLTVIDGTVAVSQEIDVVVAPQ